MATRSIEEVLQEHTEALLAVPGVVGAAQGLSGDQPCIKVYVLSNTPEVKGRIPDLLEGFPVTLVESGAVRST